MTSTTDFRTDGVSTILDVATDGTLLISDNEHSENSNNTDTSEPLVIYEVWRDDLSN